MPLNGLPEYSQGYYLFDSFKNHNCLAAFSSKRIDLGFQNNPDLKNNRYAFLEKLGISLGDLVCLQQVHGNKIFQAEKKDKGSGALDYGLAIPGYDGIITHHEHLPLAVFTADCLPVFLLDIKVRVAAIIHAGWRGSKDNIALAALEVFKHRFSSEVKDIICGLGPGIRSCCYEVGAEFKDYFSKGLVRRKGKIFLDLVNTNLKQLLGAGILKENIYDSGICTSCQNEDFFSYRRDGPNTGRIMSVIMMD